MLSDFRKKKVLHLFNTYDVDGNGHIDLNDYLRFIDRLAEQGAIKKDSKRYQTMKSETTALWNQLREHADTNRDDKVTKDEWLKWQTDMDDQAKKQGGAFPLEKYIGVLCDLMDEDQDGKISIEEYRHVVEAYGYKNVDVEGNFKLIDSNHDGYLTREEVIKTSAAFWFSEDANAPANYIYGKF